MNRRPRWDDVTESLRTAAGPCLPPSGTGQHPASEVIGRRGRVRRGAKAWISGARLAPSEDRKMQADAGHCRSLPSAQRRRRRDVKPSRLWGRFEWAQGCCFRCDRQDQEVAIIGSISSRGLEVTITACRRCVFHLEQMHWTLAERQDRLPPRLPLTAASNVGGPAPRLPQPGRGRSSRRSRRPTARMGTFLRLSNRHTRRLGQHRRTSPNY